MKKLFLCIMVAVLLPSLIFAANGKVSGKVTEKNSNEAIPATNVILDGTSIGSITDSDGYFSITDVPEGKYVILAKYIGYTTAKKEINVVAGREVKVSFKLEKTALEMDALEVLASRADKTTPVAYTNVKKEEMEVRLGSQDIPMVLNTTPSVYSTQQGGGAGDARINVRGFNQRNVAVMINGVPQNDMENGWVYWSNWDGVGDATSSIQMQRGLSAVNLATPSIGGTMNIITDPTALKRGGSFKQEAGSGSFLKTTASFNSGTIADKFAVSGSVVRKVGEGIIDKTWTDSWAYYLGASYALNSNNRFELYAIGAPQRHGQNLYKQNLMAYDKDYAAEVVDKSAMESADSDADGTSDWDEYVDKFTVDATGDEAGRLFNQNWSPITSDYKGKQYWNMYGERTTERHDANFLNERENFFHKPLVNLNHYLNINEQMRLTSVLYWSGGSGGGTGTYGKIPTLDANGNLGDDNYKYYYGDSPWVRDWNTLVDYNSGDQDTVYVDKTALARTHGDGNNQSVGILRNSINRQSTIGLISKLNYDLSDALKLQVGIDWRTASIEHAREVRDLLGGDYYMDYADDNFSSGKRVELGDIIAYHNETTVDWIGGFLQGNYTAGALSAYGMGGISSIKYSYQDHFTVADELIKSDPITAMQVKGGVMYNILSNLAVFGNFGFVEKPPIMDNVIYNDGTVASDPANEKFISTEAGVNFNTRKFAIKANVYNTDWKDRNLTKAITQGQGSSGNTDIIFLTGVNQNHKGFELEASAQVIKMLRLDASLSFGNWQFTGDADGDYQQDSLDANDQVVGITTTSYSYALDGLYIGDMPQTAYVIGATLTPITGLRIQALLNIYDDNYADWSPDSREYDGDDSNADRAQVWMAPGYSKVDLHMSYKLPKMFGLRTQLFAHVFNVLDETFVQDATDNSQYNGFGAKVHAAQNAEVFLGTPRYFNVGIKINI